MIALWIISLVKLSIKPGVRFDKDSLALGRLLATLLTLDFNGEVVITAGSDGQHMIGSRHYTGQAIDIRSFNLSDPEGFRGVFERALGPKFRVLLESDHIHAQVKRGLTYP